MTRTGTNWRHGASGYNNYGCRCDTCKAGNAAQQRAYRQRRMLRRNERMLKGRFVPRAEGASR